MVSSDCAAESGAMAISTSAAINQNSSGGMRHATQRHSRGNASKGSWAMMLNPDSILQSLSQHANGPVSLKLWTARRRASQGAYATHQNIRPLCPAPYNPFPPRKLEIEQ